MQKLILVTGATGNQGGAVVDQLLQTDFKVRALTRGPASEKAQALAARGVEVVQGDLDDAGSLVRAMEGAYGVFSVQNFMDHGVERETEQGRRVADAAQKAGVQHLVYTSVGGADRDSGVPHFESKWKIEEHIRALGLPHTILRPTLFMDNFDSPIKFPMLSLIRSVLKDRPVQMIAVADIGKWAVLAFAHPEQYLGTAVELATDELNHRQIQDTFKRVKGKRQASIWIPPALVFALMREIGLMFKWFRDHGYHADLEKSRSAIASPLRFDSWLASKTAR